MQPVTIIVTRAEGATDEEFDLAICRAAIAVMKAQGWRACTDNAPRNLSGLNQVTVTVWPI